MTQDERGGIFETKEDAGEGNPGLVKFWLEQIRLADKEEEDWRKNANDIVKLYRTETRKKSSFNILRSNINTLRPAIYNSQPVPDIRRRWNSSGELPKLASDALERTISQNFDDPGDDGEDYDDAILGTVQDYLLVGRGVGRLRYEPVLSAGPEGEQVVDEQVSFEYVEWASFRRGPAKVWKKVPWIAFHHTMTRDELVEKFGEKGNEVNLDVSVSQEKRDKDDNQPPDVMKRGRVWEVWDKDTRKVLFIAPTYSKEPLNVVDDPLRLQGFYPIPRPLYSNVDTTSLVPVPDYESYREQAEELNRVTERINKLIQVLKWRGVYDSTLGEIGRLEQSDDGELLASDNVLAVMQAGGLEGAIWMMPVERLIQIVRELYRSRSETIQVIYEITGISDILRGSTDPNETLGAQQIKAQFGTNKLQERQRAVQKYARNIIRMMAELVAEHFQPQSIIQAADMQELVQVPQVFQLLQSDQLRGWRIDIETDSTIQADMSRAQQNIGDYIQGMASFTQAFGPGVEAGVIPLDVAVDMLTAFSRVFKLGKGAEDALDRWSQQAKQAGQQGQQGQAEPQGPPPEQQAVAMKAQSEVQRTQLDAQTAQAEHQLKMQELQWRQQEGAAKHELAMTELAAKREQVVIEQAIAQLPGSTQ